MEKYLQFITINNHIQKRQNGLIILVKLQNAISVTQKITLIKINPTQIDNYLYIIEHNTTLFVEKQNIDIR